VAALAFTQVTSPDLGFLIATGRAVLTLGRIPATPERLLAALADRGPR